VKQATAEGELAQRTGLGGWLAEEAKDPLVFRQQLLHRGVRGRLVLTDAAVDMLVVPLRLSCVSDGDAGAAQSLDDEREMCGGVQTTACNGSEGCLRDCGGCVDGRRSNRLQQFKGSLESCAS